MDKVVLAITAARKDYEKTVKGLNLTIKERSMFEAAFRMGRLSLKNELLAKIDEQRNDKVELEL